MKKAKEWFIKAVKLDPDLGDSWVTYYKFTATHGTEDELKVVVDKCTQVSLSVISVCLFVCLFILFVFCVLCVYLCRFVCLFVCLFVPCVSVCVSAPAECCCRWV